MKRIESPSSHVGICPTFASHTFATTICLAVVLFVPAVRIGKACLPDLDDNDPDAAGKKDDLATINEFFDRHGLTMQKAGCSPGDIIEYWRYVIKNSNDLTRLWEYVVCDFEGAFQCYGEQHRANGYSGSPMKLVWKKVKERFPEQDPSTF